MKKLILSLAFVGMFTFFVPKDTKACTTFVLMCSEDDGHIVCLWDVEDLKFFAKYYCDADLT